MSTPFYVSPEQVMRDKSDYARKGIARGRSVLVMTYSDGILLCGENPNKALHKISEIYDRIAFAAVGKYNEFENLRVAGVRYADFTGYRYDRSDVTSRGLANAYAQQLGAIFTEAGKPFEVELTVAEVGPTVADDQLYRLTFDGMVQEEHGFIVMGGTAEPIAAVLRDEHVADADLDTAVRLGLKALSTPPEGVERRDIPVEAIEAAVLDRTRARRAFRRLTAERLGTIIGAGTS
ncbi:MAG: proteasome subunit alpha [Frankiales bacterium]|jgi:proteasome alpha subunit|nr:proteasome subunit alpha [Frankiales bacterium]